VRVALCLLTLLAALFYQSATLATIGVALAAWIYVRCELGLYGRPRAANVCTRPGKGGAT
jgi:hypothetical protein